MTKINLVYLEYEKYACCRHVAQAILYSENSRFDDSN